MFCFCVHLVYNLVAMIKKSAVEKTLAMQRWLGPALTLVAAKKGYAFPSTGCCCATCLTWDRF